MPTITFHDLLVEVGYQASGVPSVLSGLRKKHPMLDLSSGAHAPQEAAPLIALLEPLLLIPFCRTWTRTGWAKIKAKYLGTPEATPAASVEAHFEKVEHLAVVEAPPVGEVLPQEEPEVEAPARGEIVQVNGWQLSKTAEDAEPLIQDLDLARRLGYAVPAQIRRLIKSLIDEGELSGVITAAVITSQKGGRPGTAYYLNEEQTLVIVMASKAEKAREIRKEVIGVYMAYRRGDLVSRAEFDAMRGQLAAVEKESKRLAAEQSSGDKTIDRIIDTVESQAKTIGRLERLAAIQEQRPAPEAIYPRPAPAQQPLPIPPGSRPRPTVRAWRQSPTVPVGHVPLFPLVRAWAAQYLEPGASYKPAFAAMESMIRESPLFDSCVEVPGTYQGNRSKFISMQLEEYLLGQLFAQAAE